MDLDIHGWIFIVCLLTLVLVLVGYFPWRRG